MLDRLSTLLLISLSCSVFGQNLTQTVRGKVSDAESQYPLAGVVILLKKDSTLIGGTTSDENGFFSVSDVPVGKIDLNASYHGYSLITMKGVEVTSGKEVVLNLFMEESAVLLEEVVIRATEDGEPVNEMATLSARQFSVDETNRYAGSRGDPARMASNFAGVLGADDSRNDIVVRGNSPQGVLWRVEGIDIPNPNHFSIPGTAGGPVSIINNKYLANSNFFTGAFPAEYGNSIAAVFDLRLRNGNNQKHEFSGQFGFLGTEVLAEGPLSSKKNSSYLLSYRYSTVRLFSVLGIDIGTSAVPLYQDGAFRFHFPGKKQNSLSFWAIGGTSSVDILISDQESPEERNIYGDNDRDQYFRSKMGIVGATYLQSLSEKSLLKVSSAISGNQQDSYHELVYRHVENELYVIDSMSPLLDYRFNEAKVSVSAMVTHKFNKNHTLRGGFLIDHYIWNFTDSVRIIDTSNADYYSWQTRWNFATTGQLLQPFVQWKYRPNNHWTINVGVHTQSFTLSHSFSGIEPRIGIKYAPDNRHSWSASVGRHSQLQPTYLYFYDPQNSGVPLNQSVGFTKSNHYIIAHEFTQGKWRIRTEAYMQELFDIPVEKKSSSFSLVNTGAGFNRFFPDTLVNEGTARNQGVELTIERFFSKGWLMLFSATLFDSKYKGSDGVERNTDFNGKYAANLLASKQFSIGDKKALILGGKVTTAGGRWYGPADISASNQQRELVYVDSLRNTQQFRPYFRFDVKVNFQINTTRFTHEIGVDFVNILNTKNVLRLTYAPHENADPNSSIREEYQLGFLPIFFYRFDF